MTFPKSLNPGRQASACRALTESELVKAVIAGNLAASNELCHRVRDPIRLTLMEILGESDRDIDDWSQIALEQVIRTINTNRFQQRCRVRSWARVIARNVAFSGLRRRMAERQVLLCCDVDELSEFAELATDRGERCTLARCDVALVKRQFGKMSPTRAQAVWLHDALGYELSEIASRVGASAAAVQSRLVRGRRELLRKLESTACDNA